MRYRWQLLVIMALALGAFGGDNNSGTEQSAAPAISTTTTHATSAQATPTSSIRARRSSFRRSTDLHRWQERVTFTPKVPICTPMIQVSRFRQAAIGRLRRYLGCPPGNMVTSSACSASSRRNPAARGRPSRRGRVSSRAGPSENALGDRPLGLGVAGRWPPGADAGCGTRRRGVGGCGGTGRRRRRRRPGPRGRRCRP
jgi:hypothetical protein